MTKALPLYQQIRDHILSLIHSGELGPGDRLPTEAALATQFSTARATVVHALKELVFDGTIQRYAGRGSFVAVPKIDTPIVPGRITSLEEQWQNSGKKITYEIISFERSITSEQICQRLHLPKEAKISRLKRVRLANDLPMSLELRSFSSELAARIPLASFESKSFITLMREDAQISTERVEGIIAATLADTELAEALRVSVGAPLILRDYVFYGADGTPISHGTSYFRSEVTFHYQTLNA